MKVDVVPLRLKGEKRSREIAKASQVVCGDLTVRSRLGLGKEVILVATLAGSRFELLLPALDHVRLTRMSGDSFILFGIEEVSFSRRSHQTYPQAWWCRRARQEEETPAREDRTAPLDPAVTADLYLAQAEY